MAVLNLTGCSVCDGLASGKVLHYVPFSPSMEENHINPEAVPEALSQYKAAVQTAFAELVSLHDRLDAALPEKAKIFSAHQDILMDDAMDEDIRNAIMVNYLSPVSAVSATYDQYISMIMKSKNPLIRERTIDMADVKNRLLRCLLGIPDINLSTLCEDTIIVAHELLPSDTASLDFSHVRGIITETGGATSHTAILAKSYGVPALLGVVGAQSLLPADAALLLDTTLKEAILDPSPAQYEVFYKKKNRFDTEAAKALVYLGADSRMADGSPISICLNLNDVDEPLSEDIRVDGVGLFRTEFLYMGTDTLPSEETQMELYKKVLLRFRNQPVTIRTLDIGGDKKSPCLQLLPEDNPFLGNRALRFCFSNPDIFRTQLRACLRASVFGDLWLMFPMVGSLDDIRKAKAFVEEAKADLRGRGIPFAENVKFGIMVEIPSIALIADLIVDEVDFCSIGTNDLTQYTLAADRMNPSVNSYYQTLHPGLLRLIQYVATQFRRAGKPVCVCGEMGGDPYAAAVLLGLGIDHLSMGVSSVAKIKQLLHHLSLSKAEELANTVLGLSTAGEVDTFLHKELNAIFAPLH